MPISAPARVPIEKIDRRHDEYKLYADAWEDFALLNKGGVDLRNQFARFLVRRPMELYDVYQERAKRITQQPILGTVTGWYNAALFRRNPEIDISPEGAGNGWYADDFLTNCDLANTAFIDFFRRIFTQLQLFGRAWVLIDLPQTAAIPQSRADEQDLGLDRPYLVNYDPRQVINWKVDNFGNLSWAVTKWVTEEAAFLGPSDKYTYWCYYDSTQYLKYRAKGENPDLMANFVIDTNGNQDKAEADLVDSGPHALTPAGRPPLRCITVPEALWIANRAYLMMLDHLNQDNSYSWALFMANLAMPFICSDSQIANPKLSEAAWLKLGKDDKFGWTEPDGKSFTHAANRLEMLREEIYRAFYLQAQGRKSSATAASSSGYSKELDMMPANDVLNGYGDIIRCAMQDVLGDVAEVRADQSTTFNVRGFRFEVKPATESISMAQELVDLGIQSPTLEKEVFKRVARDVGDDWDPDLLDTICSEIDAAPAPSEVAAQQQQQQQQMFAKSFGTMQNRAQAKEEETSLIA
jgi:hypothetical protein